MSTSSGSVAPGAPGQAPSSSPDFTDLIDLAGTALGGAVIAANDEFFAPKEALLKPGPAEWREGEYTERGKWMDGWETRRRRTAGHDWAVVRLGAPGEVKGVVIDTSWFRGNYPERASLEGCNLPGNPSAEDLSGSGIPWTILLPEVPLAGDSRNAFAVDRGGRVTHLRLNIFPDGGVARLRVHGVVRPATGTLHRAGTDLAAAENGGFVVVCSDMFFGHRQNLILPGRSTHMGNGWETKRRRGPGHDWTIVRLGARATIDRVELDTDHFKGNAPDACMLETCDRPAADASVLTEAGVRWRELIPRTKLQPHARHELQVLAEREPATHVRLSIFPDGGVARLRLYGTVAR
jgi:allantoicase